MKKNDFRRCSVDVPLDIHKALESVVGRFGKEYRSKQVFMLEAIEEKLNRECQGNSLKTTDKSLKFKESEKDNKFLDKWRENNV